MKGYEQEISGLLATIKDLQESLQKHEGKPTTAPGERDVTSNGVGAGSAQDAAPPADSA